MGCGGLDQGGWMDTGWAGGEGGFDAFNGWGRRTAHGESLGRLDPISETIRDETKQSGGLDKTI
jgi:hypothetical protein